MEASLVIAVDERALKHRTLKTMELRDLDIYMVQHFENSTAVREDPKFKPLIEQFLVETSSYRACCSKMNNGAIRVIYTDDAGQIQTLRAYYQKDKSKLDTRHLVAQLKQDCYSSLELLNQLVSRPPLPMAPYYLREIRNGLSFSHPSWTANAIQRWVKDLCDVQEDPITHKKRMSSKGYFQIRQLSRYVEKFQADQERRYVRSVSKEELEATEDQLVFFGSPKDIKPIVEVQDESDDYRPVDYFEQVDDPEELFNLYPLEQIVKKKGIRAFRS